MGNVRDRAGWRWPVVTATALAVVTAVALAVVTAVALAAGLTLAAAPVRAQEDTQDTDAGTPGGFYVTAGGSLGIVNDPQTTENFEVDLGSEIGLFGGLGYGLGPFRAEAQLLAEAFQVDNLNPVGPTALPPGNYQGSLRSVGLMANALVSFPRLARARPYLGIGGGYVRMTPDYRDNSCVFIFCTSGISAAGGSDTVAAWQGMAGITVPAQRPGDEWDFGYRHFATNSADFRLTGGTPFTQEGIRSHSFQINYRHYFGGATD